MKFIIHEVCYRPSVKTSLLMLSVRTYSVTQLFARAISLPILNNATTTMERFLVFSLLRPWHPRSLSTRNFTQRLGETVRHHRSICYLGRREENRWRRGRECSVGQRRRGWRNIKPIFFLRCIRASWVSVLCFVYALRPPWVDLPLPLHIHFSFDLFY